MDSGLKRKREINPRENASLLSIILFFFTFKTIRKGARTELKDEDIYEILNDFRSEKLGDDFEKLWNQELLKPKPMLIRPVLKMCFLEYLFLWVTVTILEVFEIILKPIFTGKIISYFEPNATITKNETLLYVLGLIVFHLIHTFYDPSFLMILRQMCMKIRIACSSLLYRKCLKLNLATSPKYVSGTMITLITKDLNQFENALDITQMMVNGVFYMMIMTVIMYNEIGVAALVGSSVLFLLIPIQMYLGNKAAEFRLKTLQNTDQRVKLAHELLTAIRIIKMYTWEPFFSKAVKKVRMREIKCLRWLLYVKAFAISLGLLSARLALYICVITYIALGNHISAEKAFVVVGCFGALQAFLAFIMPAGIGHIAELKASLGRLTNFLLLDEITPNENYVTKDSKEPQLITKKVTVLTDTKMPMLQNINLEIKPGLTAVTGNVGSGKSTLLKALLGDLKIDGGIVEVSGKVSYASQEPWLFPSTVKQNIIFGEPFDQERYAKIVQVCALNKDFSSFPQGDQTCLTDKGLNLSRGQKTRINLARAIYREADIYLLDDCLSAVDTRVGKHIFYECIKEFLKNKICVLVTHQCEFFKEVDYIVVLNNGHVEFHGLHRDFIKKSSNLEVSLKYEKDTEFDYSTKVNNRPIQNSENAHEAAPLLNNSVQAENLYSEHNEEGAVKKEVYYKLFAHGGGLIMGFMVLVIAVAGQVADSWSDYFVSFWVDTEQDMSGFRFNHTTHSIAYKHLQESHSSIMKQYSLVILAASVLSFLKTFSYVLFFSKVSVNLHSTILSKILNAKMLFFDSNLSGNVINRFSRDLGIIDEETPPNVYGFLSAVLALCGILFVVSSVNIYFIVPSIIFTIMLYFARRYYMPTGRSIRRLEGATRSPVIGHMNATFEGITTIRASQAQRILEKEYDGHQNLYNSVSFISLSVNRAFGLYLTLLSTIYIAFILFTFLFMKTDSQAGKIGLAITQSFGLTGTLQWVFRQWAELEIQMTSAERVLEYTQIEGENKEGEKPKNWPSQGKIIYDDVNLQYSPTSEKVLKHINFIIEPNTKIGIVGRTGAGKSSIISSLFRMYEFQGLISIDDVDINELDVTLLRSQISMIPQDPVLFSGTVRSNIDPNEEYDDKEIWSALEEVEMKSLIKDLESPIADAGSNYSIGQRQLFCLARAIVHKNKILVLDEATANIDPQTDSLIQEAIKRKFTDCTIITVAHRLNTILDSDKVLVMDSGVAIEYDSPKILLSNEDGMFYKMVREAGLIQVAQMNTIMTKL